MVAVGLTGGIGAGKSTALALFGCLGAITVSADEVVHGLYLIPELKAELIARVGSGVLDGRGEVDRALLASALRGDRTLLRWLEQLTHPRVSAEIERQVGQASPGSVIVCEVPLLFETGHEALFDLVVTIEASSENRRLRSVHCFDEASFSEFEGLQASSERRVAGSDLAFFNDGSLGQLEQFVREVYERARALLPEAGGGPAGR